MTDLGSHTFTWNLQGATAKTEALTLPDGSTVSQTLTPSYNQAKKQFTVAVASILTPAVTPPPATVQFGIAGAIQNENWTPALAEDLDLIQKSGAKWQRIDINWNQIQSGGSSSYNWTNIDAEVNGIISRGLKVLGVILYTPSWAGATGITPPSPAAYAAFCATAVEHYAALGVHAYEVWNEANHSQSWTTPNPGAYTALLKAAYPAIKAADPSATVLTCGLSPAATTATSYSPVDFLTGIYANGGKGFFDAVGHHPYTWPESPGDTDPQNTWYQMYGTTPSLRSVMTANGDSVKQIWGTEFGAPTNGPGSITEAAQATMITKAMTLWKTYPWAGPLFIYTARDAGTDATNWYDWEGLVRYDFSLKSSYYAYQQCVV